MRKVPQKIAPKEGLQRHILPIKRRTAMLAMGRRPVTLHALG
jgi:hypothetical protein